MLSWLVSSVSDLEYGIKCGVMKLVTDSKLSQDVDVPQGTAILQRHLNTLEEQEDP